MHNITKIKSKVFLHFVNVPNQLFVTMFKNNYLRSISYNNKHKEKVKVMKINVSQKYSFRRVK